MQFTLVSKINFKETFLTTVRNKLQFNIAVLCLVEIQGDQTTMICSKYPSRNGGDFLMIVHNPYEVWFSFES